MFSNLHPLDLHKNKTGDDDASANIGLGIGPTLILVMNDDQKCMFVGNSVTEGIGPRSIPIASTVKCGVS